MPNLTWQKIILALTVLGAGAAIWLINVHLNLAAGVGGLQSNCAIVGGGSSGCEQIALSKYSLIFGFIPLASLALGFYLSIFALACTPFFNAKPTKDPFRIAFALSCLGVLVTLAMMFISFGVEKALCQWCMVLWLVNFALFFATALSLNEKFSAVFGQIGKIAEAGSDTVTKFIVTIAVSFVIAVVGTLVVKGNMLKGSEDQYATPERGVRRYMNAPLVKLPEQIVSGNAIKGSQANDPLLTIVKFSDFECPACQFAAKKLKPFILRNNNDVRLIYRNFPLDGKCNQYVPHGSHYHACNAAFAAYCAGQQGRFFAYHDAVFDNQSSLSEQVFVKLAKQTGLDMDKFESCRNSAETKQAIARDIEWAELVNIESTPTLIINGRKIAGGLGLRELEGILDYVRKGKK